MPFDPTLLSFLLGLAATLLSAGWVSATWFSKKFKETQDGLDSKIDTLELNIIKKLEYHERHDDERFAEIRNAVWDIRVRNAARDRDMPSNVN